MRKLWLLALLGSLGLQAPALAGTADFTGVITLFNGAGSGIPTTGLAIHGSGTGVSFGVGASSFSVPSGAFVTNRTTSGGFTSNAPANAVYTIRTITNSFNLSGFFSGTPTTGPYSGVMGSGAAVQLELGIVPLPNVFGTLFVPLNPGSNFIATEMASVPANPVTVTVVGAGWTTGQIVVNDQTVSAPTATLVTATTVTGTNQLTANGGSITLVTPFMVRLSGTIRENLAGYATMSLNFSNVVPEPTLLTLLLGGAFGLAFLGRRAGPRR